MIPFNWTCPYCDRAQTVVDNRIQSFSENITVGEHPSAVIFRAIGCANSECRKVTLTVDVRRALRDRNYNVRADFESPAVLSRRLLPPSAAKPQPDFIPAPIVEDYMEASAVCDDSPKAAATLARRCLQGMIRDFAGISKNTLFEEIRALRQAVGEGTAPQGVTQDTVDAIDHIRGVGNIGAHMQKDINLIVQVDPGEARALLNLIEMLFEEWYVARAKRKESLARIAQIGSQKKDLIAAGGIGAGLNANDKEVG